MARNKRPKRKAKKQVYTGLTIAPISQPLNKHYKKPKRPPQKDAVVIGSMLEVPQDEYEEDELGRIGRSGGSLDQSERGRSDTWEDGIGQFTDGSHPAPILFGRG